MKRLLPIIAGLCCMLYGGPAHAQIGGLHAYTFLNLPLSARHAALGGMTLAFRDDDPVTAGTNPATLNPQMDGVLSFNHAFLAGGIQHGYAAFAKYLDARALTLHGGLQYVRYGLFDRTDEYGQVQGDFKAADYALTIGAGKQLYERLSVGANLRLISSRLESYQSLGLSTDLALMYHDTARLLQVALVFRNAGVQLTPYVEGTREPLPFDLQLNVTHRLRHLPFRFAVVYHHLQRWNVLYDDPNLEDNVFLFGEPQPESPWKDRIDNFFRHLVFSGELLAGARDNFRLRLSYNHLRHKEMTVGTLRSLAGFGFGLGIKVNRFRIDYGRAIYHLGGGINHFSISTNMHEFGRKRRSMPVPGEE